jgi:hypothetical protein
LFHETKWNKKQAVPSRLGTNTKSTLVYVYVRLRYVSVSFPHQKKLQNVTPKSYGVNEYFYMVQGKQL